MNSQQKMFKDQPLKNNDFLTHKDTEKQPELENSRFGVTKDFQEILMKERDKTFLDRLDQSQNNSQLSLTQIFKSKHLQVGHGKAQSSNNVNQRVKQLGQGSKRLHFDSFYNFQNGPLP